MVLKVRWDQQDHEDFRVRRDRRVQRARQVGSRFTTRTTSIWVTALILGAEEMGSLGHYYYHYLTTTLILSALTPAGAEPPLRHGYRAIVTIQPIRRSARSMHSYTPGKTAPAPLLDTFKILTAQTKYYVSMIDMGDFSRDGFTLPQI
jgi:hypothetical protein